MLSTLEEFARVRAERTGQWAAWQHSQKYAQQLALENQRQRHRLEEIGARGEQRLTLELMQRHLKQTQRAAFAEAWGPAFREELGIDVPVGNWQEANAAMALQERAAARGDEEREREADRKYLAAIGQSPAFLGFEFEGIQEAIGDMKKTGMEDGQIIRVLERRAGRALGAVKIERDQMESDREYELKFRKWKSGEIANLRKQQVAAAGNKRIVADIQVDINALKALPPDFSRLGPRVRQRPAGPEPVPGAGEGVWNQERFDQWLRTLSQDDREALSELTRRAQAGSASDQKRVIDIFKRHGIL